MPPANNGDTLHKDYLQKGTHVKSRETRFNRRKSTPVADSGKFIKMD